MKEYLQNKIFPFPILCFTVNTTMPETPYFSSISSIIRFIFQKTFEVKPFLEIFVLHHLYLQSYIL